ncbi:hypothetical protein [Flammeovirga sp. EKP202]|uniref:hypothetical protein n=1 Tax=Flammeovirga sp. EKP202 TaxID=2770592 RepID=UPI00165EBF6E|nr:hypothetical protein [Flammeovirga sp. EKP202]MBD0401535.1 hypothetical protein [Flammeovirga sp. EKP202]
MKKKEAWKYFVIGSLLTLVSGIFKNLVYESQTHQKLYPSILRGVAYYTLIG